MRVRAMISAAVTALLFVSACSEADPESNGGGDASATDGSRDIMLTALTAMSFGEFQAATTVLATDSPAAMKYAQLIEDYRIAFTSSDVSLKKVLQKKQDTFTYCNVTEEVPDKCGEDSPSYRSVRALQFDETGKITDFDFYWGAGADKLHRYAFMDTSTPIEWEDNGLAFSIVAGNELEDPSNDGLCLYIEMFNGDESSQILWATDLLAGTTDGLQVASDSDGSLEVFGGQRGTGEFCFPRAASDIESIIVGRSSYIQATETNNFGVAGYFTYEAGEITLDLSALKFLAPSAA